MSTLNQALRAALANRDALLAELHRQGTDCYRLFHGSQEGAGGLTIDRYGPQLLVQSFHQALERGTGRAIGRDRHGAGAQARIGKLEHGEQCHGGDLRECGAAGGRGTDRTAGANAVQGGPR